MNNLLNCSSVLFLARKKVIMVSKLKKFCNKYKVKNTNKYTIILIAFLQIILFYSK